MNSIINYLNIEDKKKIKKSLIKKKKNYHKNL